MSSDWRTHGARVVPPDGLDDRTPQPPAITGRRQWAAEPARRVSGPARSPSSRRRAPKAPVVPRTRGEELRNESHVLSPFGYACVAGSRSEQSKGRCYSSASDHRHIADGEVPFAHLDRPGPTRWITRRSPASAHRHWRPFDPARRPALHERGAHRRRSRSVSGILAGPRCLRLSVCGRHRPGGYAVVVCLRAAYIRIRAMHTISGDHGPDLRRNL